jgi:hypothetical protein
LSSDRLKKAIYILMFTKNCQKTEKLNLKVSYSSKNFNNVSNWFSIFLYPKLRDYTNVIFYIHGHLRKKINLGLTKFTKKMKRKSQKMSNSAIEQIM